MPQHLREGPTAPAPMNGSQQGLRPLVTLIVLLLVIWMLRAAVSVLMPLAVSILIVMLIWPLEAWLERRIPRSLSVVASVLALTLGVCLMGLVFWFCGNAVAAREPEYQQQFNAFVGRIDARLSHYRLLAHFRNWNPTEAIGEVVSLAESFAVATSQVIGVLLLIVVFVVLLLIEVQPFSSRFRERFPGERSDRMMGAAKDTAASIRRFTLMRTLTCATAGLLTGLFTWAIGLDLALVWAVMAFVLNYVPVFGSIVAVIPPTLAALIEPGRPWLVFVTLGGLTVVHFGVGNYLDPFLQGRYLSLPPIVVFYSLVLWFWVWGVPGALLGVPLTMSIVVTCKHFERTRWVARLLLSR